jgi:hypothetical protein
MCEKSQVGGGGIVSAPAREGRRVGWLAMVGG